ncbi:undecaprenyl-diphosphate phosphatase [Stackebrandtia soli]|uniref:undecaprenyl-diphosphate phosphatase n=1 Tax=Stackebrandtia soli TaxID=1892856 RepID=UPI0039E79DC9
MELWHAVILGIVEGLTELLPVSSTGHLTVVEELLGLDVDDPGVTGFTAFIQIGAIAAVLVYFAKDIWAITTGFFRGLFSAEHRTDYEYRMGWYIIVGSLPIIIVGFVGKDLITGPLRSLWFVAGGMILWSFVLWFAEYAATHQRTERQITMKDALFVGVVQSIALVPGISRSGASTAAGLLRDLDRVAATKLSFYLGIPALTGAGVLEAKDAFTGSVELAPLLVGTVVSGIVAYISVAWLLKFVANHSFMLFVWYRIGFGVVVIGLILLGVIAA